ncbi:MAG: hypothetical protein KC486_00545 [Myxococcales bacterium]|nr:hypothetical protein [Myxococcales bacterium]
MDSESESQTAGQTTLGSATNSTTQGSASTSATATSAGSSATESDSDGTSASSGTTASSDSATSDDSATEGTGTTTGGATATTGDDTTTTGDGTTDGTTTDGGTTTGGDVPDFVADCDDDPDNPVIVTVEPNVTARFPTIVSGLAASSDGSIIEVCPGTYNDKIEVTIDVTLRGAGADKTIINGGGFYFKLGNGEAVVEGFGFTNSNAKVPSGWNISTSGAISVDDTYGEQEKLTIRDCRFFDNSAEYGGGVHVDGSNNGGKNPDIYIENSVFEGNVVTAEGGAIASYGRVHIKDSVFISNQARTGGALALSYGCTGLSACDITNTVIRKNHTTGTGQYEGGGGIFIDDCGFQCLSGLKVTNSDLGFGAAEENTDYQGLPEDVLINDGGAPWNRYGWYYNDVSFTCSNGTCTMP